MKLPQSLRWKEVEEEVWYEFEGTKILCPVIGVGGGREGGVGK